MKKCPHCAEEIQDEATKCKHCKTMLTSEITQIKTKINIIILAVVVGVILLAGGAYAVKTYYLPQNDQDNAITENNSPTTTNNLTTTTTIPSTLLNEEIAPTEITTKPDVATPTKQNTEAKKPQVDIIGKELESGKNILEIMQQANDNASILFNYCLLPTKELRQLSDKTRDEMAMAMALIIDSYNKINNIIPPSKTLETIHQQVKNGINNYVQSIDVCLELMKTTDEIEHINLGTSYSAYFSKGFQQTDSALKSFTDYAVILNQSLGEYAVPEI